MAGSNRTYKAAFSSDWSECLSPNGPFDCLVFHHPRLKEDLSVIFRHYTSNRITLSQALKRIQGLIPELPGPEQMDAYLEASFATYRGVPDLMEWCGSKGVLFMINTTGFQGYFQRAVAKGLLPRIPALSAHPMIRYAHAPSDPPSLYDLREIEDKPANTQRLLRHHGIAAQKTVIMGDSGGDGPHFAWGARAGALLVGSMTKASLEGYCREMNLVIHHRFGLTYPEGTPRQPEKEMEVDFMGLVPLLEEVLSR